MQDKNNTGQKIIHFFILALFQDFHCLYTYSLMSCKPKDIPVK